EGPHMARLVDGGMAHMAVEVAVGALGEAERPVHVDAEGWLGHVWPPVTCARCRVHSNDDSHKPVVHSMTPPNRPRFACAGVSRWRAAGDVGTLYVPHLIGQGISLFGGDTRPSNLRLTRSRPYPNGLVCLDYDVLR